MRESSADTLAVSSIWSRPPEASGVCPPSADVVVLGGGIVGTSAAYFLARKGISVALCEKGHIAGEQSGRNWGWVRQQGRAAAEIPMMMMSLGIWRGLAQEIGEDVGFEQGGCLYLARTERELEQHARWLDTARAYGVDTRVLGAAELGDVLASEPRGWYGALYTPSDGRAEPHKAAPAIARAAARSGASILTRCAVRGIETEGGRVATVVTERGTIRTRILVCAAGAWTSLFCGSLGITFPQLRVRNTVARTGPARDITRGEAWSEPVAIRRRQDGGYTIAHGAASEHFVAPASFRFFKKYVPAMRREGGAIRLRAGRLSLDELTTPRGWRLDAATPFERVRVLDPPPSPPILKEMRRNLDRYFPELARAPFVESWAGMIEVSPDVKPVISSVPELPGLYVASGFSGHGFGIGPGAGRVVADLVSGGEPGIDLAPFRLSRFFDGSKLELGPTI